MGRVFLLVAALAVGTALAGCTGTNGDARGDSQMMSHDSNNGGDDRGMSTEETGRKDTSHEGTGAAGGAGAEGDGSQGGNGTK